MKINSLLAFVCTLLAFLMVFGLISWFAIENVSRISKSPEYCKNFSIQMEPEMASVKLEAGRGKLIKVNVTNEGFEDFFKITSEGPKWIATRPLNMRLNQGQSEDIFVYISPPKGVEGIYQIDIYAKSYCGFGKTKIDISV